MRTSQTFILRLLLDSDEPAALRGMLRSVASGEEQPFAGGPALLALLPRMLQTPARIQPNDLSVTHEEEEVQ